MAAAFDRVKKIWDGVKAAWAVLGFLGFSGAITGFVVAAGGAAWAMINGIAAPLVVMAAFCTFTGGVYLSLAPLAFRALMRVQDNPVKMRPDPEIWRHVSQLELYEAACLLADIQPDAQEISGVGDAYGWYRALYDAVRKTDMDRVPSIHDCQHTFEDGYHPYKGTLITRSELKKFAVMDGVIATLSADTQIVCPPSALSFFQIETAYINWAKANPDLLRQSRLRSAAAALSAAFPCPKRQ